MGYITKKVKIPAGAKELNVVLSPDDVMLEEVVVKPKKEKYSRKNNPAVEFMRKVIDADTAVTYAQEPVGMNRKVNLDVGSGFDGGFDTGFNGQIF